MNEISNLTLAQIVNSNHKAASVFEKYHLDFCCKGKRTLETACAEQEIPVNDILKELDLVFSEKGDEGFDFGKMSLSQLCDYIVYTHHALVKKELPQLYAYLEKVAGKHGDRHPELKKIFQTFAAVKEEMESHMKKEEVILFPRIKELEKLSGTANGGLQLNIAYLKSPITIMEQEHDHAGSMMNEIRNLTSDYTPPQDACTTYRLSYAALQAFELDLHQHVHLENNILFPGIINLYQKVLN